MVGNPTMGQLFYGQGENLDLTPMSQDDLRRQPSRNLIPRFFKETVGGKDGSFIEREMVEILIPGDSKSGPVHKVGDGIKARFPLQYKAWKEGTIEALTGTPLELVVGTGPVYHHLKSLNIFSAEQLAGIADAFLQELGTGARELRDRAKRILEVKDRATKLKKEEDKDRQIQELLEALKTQGARLAALEGKKARSEAPGSSPEASKADAADEKVPEGAVPVTGGNPRATRERVTRGRRR
jgi:hypothetical protein